MAISLKGNNWFFVTDQTPHPYPTNYLFAICFNETHTTTMRVKYKEQSIQSIKINIFASAHFTFFDKIYLLVFKKLILFLGPFLYSLQAMPYSFEPHATSFFLKNYHPITRRDSTSRPHT
jgi:hypothetical protein